LVEGGSAFHKVSNIYCVSSSVLKQAFDDLRHRLSRLYNHFVQFNGLADGDLAPVFVERYSAATHQHMQFFRANLDGFHGCPNEEFVGGDSHDWQQAFQQVFKVARTQALHNLGAVFTVVHHLFYKRHLLKLVLLELLIDGLGHSARL